MEQAKDPTEGLHQRSSVVSRGDRISDKIKNAKKKIKGRKNKADSFVGKIKSTKQAHWMAEVVFQHWLPLVGTFTLVQSILANDWYLSMLEFLIGFAMVHLRMVQEWILFKEGVQTDRVRSRREQFLACTALLVGIIKCIIQVSATPIDYLYFGVCTMGILWARYGRVGRRLPPPHGLHMLPIIVLAASVSTLAPPPGLASVPYALLFLCLTLLATSTGRTKIHGNVVRMLLLLMTTTHIGALLTVRCWVSLVGSDVWTNEFQDLVLFFGRVGVNIALNWKERRCVPIHHGGECCLKKDQDRGLVVAHLGALMMLHFWLCNVTTVREKEDDETSELSSADREDIRDMDGEQLPGSPEEEHPKISDDMEHCQESESIRQLQLLRSKPSKKNMVSQRSRGELEPGGEEELPERTHSGVLGDMQWVQRLAKIEPLAAVVAFVLLSPNLLTLPLVLGVCIPNPLRSLCASIRSWSSGRSDGSVNARLHVARSPIVYLYSMFIFVVLYGFSIISGGLPRFLRPHVEVATAVTEPLASNWRPWADAVGLPVVTVCEDQLWTLHVIVPQAILIICLAINQADGSFTVLVANTIEFLTGSDPQTWPVDNAIEFFVRVPAEVSMLATFVFSMLLVVEEDNFTSLFTLFYFAVLTVVLLKEIVFAAAVMLRGGDWRKQLVFRVGKYSIRWWLWLALEKVAQMAPLPLLLVYNLVGSSPDAWRPAVWFDWFFPARQTTREADIQAIVALHFGIMLWSLFERWRIELCVETADQANPDSVVATFPDHSQKLLRRLEWFLRHSTRIILLCLSVIVTMLPPVDIHSFIVLIVFSPSLLIYLLDKSRLRNALLDVILCVLLVAATLSMLQRVVFACPMTPIPAGEHLTSWKLLTLQEAGISEQVTKPAKVFVLGITAILAHFLMKAERGAYKALDPDKEAELAETSRLKEGVVAHQEFRTTSSGQLKVVTKAVAARANLVASIANRKKDGGARNQATGHTKRPSLGSLSTGAGHGATGHAFRQIRSVTSKALHLGASHHAAHVGFEDAVRAVPYRRPSLSYMRSEHVDGNAVSTTDRSRKISKMIEELLSRNLPEFFPREKHFYASVLNLFVIFGLSVSEEGENRFSLYNFLLVSSVLCLVTWRSLWVVMSVVFAVLETTCMILQYMTQFQKWDEKIATSDTSEKLGLRWSATAQVRHCIILLLCVLQRQLWHHDQRSAWLGNFRRQGVCPAWLRTNADIVGIFGLLFVAAVQQHIWGLFVALAVVPWILNSGRSRTRTRAVSRGQSILPDQTKSGEAFSRCCQRILNHTFFRLALLSILFVQISYRLLTSLFDARNDLNDRTESESSIGQNLLFFFSSICESMEGYWESQGICEKQWEKWVTAWHRSVIYEFTMLMFLGLVQMLLDNDNPRGKSVSQQHIALEQVHTTAGYSDQRRVMLWWPGLVWFFTFLVSLNGGTLLGLSNLLLLVSLSSPSTKSERRTKESESRTDKIRANLDVKKARVWRIRLNAWVFFILGLLIQSPVSPCSRPSCAGYFSDAPERHNFSWMPDEDCVDLEDLNMTRVANAEWLSSERCQNKEAVGQDNVWTEIVELIGFRRSDRKTFLSGISMLFFAQHGWLLMLIFVTTIQLRIYNSDKYFHTVYVKFVAEPPEILEMRAKRQVLEFHCRHKLEARAAWYRQRALQLKLQRTMRSIREMLNRLSSGQDQSGGQIWKSAGVHCPACLLVQSKKTNEDETKTQLEKRLRTVEAVQVSHGVSESLAQDVTRMFNNNVSAAKKYFNMMDRVAIGRLQPSDSRACHDRAKLTDVMKELKAMSDDPFLDKMPEDEEDDAKEAEAAGMATKIEEPAAVDARGKMTWMRDTIYEHWLHAKNSAWFADLMVEADYAFLGVDERSLHLRSAKSLETEELDLHRIQNGPVRLLWKCLLANMRVLIGLAHVLAFIQTPSILELVRLITVFYGALRVYPFPVHAIWSGLFRYGAALLIFRTVYNFNIFCPFPDLFRSYTEHSQNVYTLSWCDVQHNLGTDFIFGIAKRSGTSAVLPVAWPWAVYADHLCLWTLTLHIWMLKRSGMIDHVVFDTDSHRLLLERNEARRESVSSIATGDDEPPLLELQPGDSMRMAGSMSVGGHMWWHDEDQRSVRLRENLEVEVPKIPDTFRGSWIDERMLENEKIAVRFYDSGSAGFASQSQGPDLLYDGTYIVFTEFDWGPMCPTHRRHREAKFTWKQDQDDANKLCLIEKSGAGAGQLTKHLICELNEKGVMVVTRAGPEKESSHKWTLKKITWADETHGKRHELMERLHGVWQDIDLDFCDGGHVVFNHAGWYPCVHSQQSGKRSNFKMIREREDGCVLLEVPKKFVTKPSANSGSGPKTTTFADDSHNEQYNENEHLVSRGSASNVKKPPRADKQIYILTLKNNGATVQIERAMEVDGKYEPSQGESSYKAELQCVLGPMRGRWTPVKDVEFFESRLEEARALNLNRARIAEIEQSLEEARAKSAGAAGHCAHSKAMAIQQPRRMSAETPALLIRQYHDSMVKQYLQLRENFEQEFEQDNSEALERRRRRMQDAEKMKNALKGKGLRDQSDPSSKSQDIEVLTPDEPDLGSTDLVEDKDRSGSGRLVKVTSKSSKLIDTPPVERKESLDSVDDLELGPRAGTAGGSTGAVRVLKSVMTDLFIKPFKKEDRGASTHLTCLGGAPLTENVVEPSRRTGEMHFSLTCACCGQELSHANNAKAEAKCYSCNECDYHICLECVKTGAAMQQQNDAERKLIKPGMSVYWLQFVTALMMFAVVLLCNAQILGNADVNFIRALVQNNFSVSTIVMVFFHLVILVSDRALYNLTYRARSDKASAWLQAISRYGGLVQSILIFLWIHILCIVRLVGADSSTRLLSNFFELYLYYVCCMLYLAASVAREKFGLPAVEADEYKLRPVDPVESQGIYTEKVRYFYFVGQTALPFVDDLRIVVDWSVMPTSLDLWMHWKVEDAYNLFFKTRHQMFVRRQSHWAETRDPYEKCYNGWIVVVGIIALLLVPIVIFNPEFNSSFLSSGTDTVTGFSVSTTVHFSANCSAIGSGSCTSSMMVFSGDAAKTKESAGDVGFYNQYFTWQDDSDQPFFASPATFNDLWPEATGRNAFLMVVQVEFNLARASTTAEPLKRQRYICYCQPFVDGACPALSDDKAFDRGMVAMCNDGVSILDFEPTRQQLGTRSGGGGNNGNDGNNSWRFVQNLTLPDVWMKDVELGNTGSSTVWTVKTSQPVRLEFTQLGTFSYWGRVVSASEASDNQLAETSFKVKEDTLEINLDSAPTFGSATSLYLGVVLIAGKYLRGVFQYSSTRAFWEEIPDVDGFLDLISAIKIARDHGDLGTEFQLYYCLMKVLRSPVLLTAIGGADLEGYGVGRSDQAVRGRGVSADQVPIAV